MPQGTGTRVERTFRFPGLARLPVGKPGEQRFVLHTLFRVRLYQVAPARLDLAHDLQPQPFLISTEIARNSALA